MPRLASIGLAHRVNDSVAPAAMLELLGRLRPRDPFEEIVAQLECPAMTTTVR